MIHSRVSIRYKSESSTTRQAPFVQFQFAFGRLPRIIISCNIGNLAGRVSLLSQAEKRWTFPPNCYWYLE